MQKDKLKKKRSANTRLRKNVAKLNKAFDGFKQAMIGCEEYLTREEVAFAQHLELSAIALALQLRNITTAALLIGGSR